MQPSLSYSDVFLIPKYSEYRSRDEAGTAVEFGERAFRLPIVPANMLCVIDENIARWLSANGYFYIMHRFNKDESDPPNFDNWKFLETANYEKWKTISISVGVQDYDKKFLIQAAAGGLRIDFLNIDIAHGHSIKMKEMLQFVKSMNVVDYAPVVIAGNVGTPEAVQDLEMWGADIIKCGLSQGGACSTFGMTGFGLPMFSCILDCAAVAKKPIIADGGVRTNGDFAKAIRAGATMVMAGSVFAACKDAPGKSLHKNAKEKVSYLLDKGMQYEWDQKEITHKVYFGSASEDNKHSKRHVEGIRVELPCNGKTYEEKYQEIADSYSSSISYAGGNLQDVKWGVKQ